MARGRAEGVSLSLCKTRPATPGREGLEVESLTKGDDAINGRTHEGAATRSLKGRVWRRPRGVNTWWRRVARLEGRGGSQSACTDAPVSCPPNGKPAAGSALSAPVREPPQHTAKPGEGASGVRLLGRGRGGPAAGVGVLTTNWWGPTPRQVTSEPNHIAGPPAGPGERAVEGRKPSHVRRPVGANTLALSRHDEERR